jgi:N-acyl-phosphatidylethanolamine-hydrolysing phospholipase D
MDADTLKNIFKREQKPLVFAPLGNAPFLKSVRAPEENIHVMDWWQSKHVKIELPSSDGLVTLSFDITCTPCQHFTGRHLFDDFTTLWSSWVIQSPSPSQSLSGKVPITTAVDSGRDDVKGYFAGDTGYRTVKEGEDENQVPTCPAFKEIGDVFGGFDFAMIPIG